MFSDRKMSISLSHSLTFRLLRLREYSERGVLERQGRVMASTVEAELQYFHPGEYLPVWRVCCIRLRCASDPKSALSLFEL